MRIGKYKFKMKKNTKRWRKPLAIGAIAILLVSMFSLYSTNKSTPSAKAAWYQNDGSWPYRQKFQVSSSAALTDYQTVLDEGEVGYWKLDESSGTNAADSSGYANNGTTSNVSWSQADKKFGAGSASFTGSSSSTILTTNTLGISGAQSRTVAFWFKPGSVQGRQDLFSFGAAANGQMFNILYDYTTADEGLYFGGYIIDQAGSTNTINRGAWNFVCVTYDGTRVKVYINGNTTPDINAALALNTADSTLYLGRSKEGTPSYYTGLEDEFRIYNRAFSASEMTYLYTNNVSPKLQQLYANTQESGADLRFTTSDQTTNIPYYLEKYTATGQNAKIYLKVPSVANGTTDIYAYYGNGGASAVSSGTSTFDFFDDFESYASGSSIDGQGGWVIRRTGGSGGAKVQTVDGKKMLQVSSTSIMTAVNNGNIGTKNITSSLGYSIESSDYATSYAEYNGIGFSSGTSINSNGECPYNGYIIGWLGWGGGASKIRRCINGSVGDLTSISDSAANSVYYRHTITWLGTTLTAYRNSVLKTQVTDSIFSSFDNVFINVYSGAIWNHDWIRIRKLASTEPTVALSGAEEIGDLIAPSNPSSITALSALGGDALSASNVYAHSAPYFDWPAVDAAGGASDTGGTIPSGVAGYYSYFGTSCGGGGANPATTRGLLSEVGGTGVHYSADTEVTSPTLTTAGTYCLRMKTKDNFGNVQGTVWEAFVYQFDNVAPNAPSYIAASPSGYTATNSFSFSWPIATDGTSSPQAGIAGYQYKRGSGSGDSWSAAQVGRSVSGVSKYQDGANVFIVRSVDTAGNTSGEVQTSYYYNANAPTKPGSLAVSPDQLSQTNAFSFTWTKPVHGTDIVDYGYSVNAWPTNTNITWIGSSDLSLASGPYATQQGINDFYLVAKDEVGNYAFDAANVAQISFECDSVAPPVPTSFAITDSSNRTADIWSLTLKWVAGVGQNQSSFDHYSIYRSDDNATFAEIATTASASYVDTTSLVSDTTYYYYIKAVDNADQASAASTTVSRMPTGKYLSPPTFVSTEPTVTTKAGEATIGWVTDRNSSSMVRFGTDQNTLDNSQGQLDSVTDHSVTVKGLKSSTTYYYQVQSLDEMRDYSSDLGYSAKFSFVTTGLPSIANVNVSNITLTSADISWETTAATNHTVNYGTSINYDKSEEGDSGSYVTNHSLKLQNLSHSATYHFKISGSDQDGNAVDADDHVFETQKMPEISFISYNQGNDGPTPIITVEWKTNVPTTSSIQYFPKDGSVKDGSEQSESAMITEHKMILQGLSDSTEYTFSVFGRDQFGNLARSSENVLKTNDDKRPPKIDDVVYEVSNVAAGSEDESRVFVYWKTDEPSTSQVEYGEGIKGEQFTQNTKEDGLLTDSHLVIVSGLKNQSPHFMRACSKDKAGNQSCSETSTVVPGEAKKSVFQRLLDAIVKNFAWVGRIVGI